MYGGTKGKWRVITSSSAPSESDIHANEVQGYEFVCVTSHQVNNAPWTAAPPTFVSYYRYRGGMHPNAVR
jgi:hypothetical protein